MKYSCTKNECETPIIARYGMLECGMNYKGTLDSQCITCSTIDDEEHRLNDWLKDINFCNSIDKIPFNTKYEYPTTENNHVSYITGLEHKNRPWLNEQLIYYSCLLPPLIDFIYLYFCTVQ